MRSYVDSDVLIWHLRGQSKAADFLASLSRSGADLWIGALQRAEIVFFMRADEAKLTMQLLSRFKTAPVNAEIVDDAGALYRQWNPSHSIDVNDAILAATVMKSGGRIFTLNSRHYPMPDLVVTRAW
jgi:predicted nucleic acid-binding protein